MIYMFVIDTDTDAKEFERELCAYTIGIADDFSGDEEAVEFFDEEGFDQEGGSPFVDAMEYPDGEPSVVWATPGWFNNGLGGRFKDGEEEQARKHRREVCLKEACVKSVYTRERVDWLRRWSLPLIKHPAYQSVAFLFRREPTEDEMNLIMRRASKYCDEDGIGVLGFRLLSENTTTKEERRWEPFAKVGV